MSTGKLDQLGMHKAAVGQQDNPLPRRQDQQGQVQQPFVVPVPDLHALASEHAPDQGNGPSPIDDGYPNQDAAVAQVGRIQSQVHDLRQRPVGESGSHQWKVELDWPDISVV